MVKSILCMLMKSRVLVGILIFIFDPLSTVFEDAGEIDFLTPRPGSLLFMFLDIVCGMNRRSWQVVADQRME